MAQNLTFTSWKRSNLFDLDLDENPGGRLSGRIPIVITDTNTGQRADDEAPFTLMAAVDIAGLKPGAIKHMAPAPFCRDAETTKVVHLDLWEPSLPWRYTPEKNREKLRPWLVLLVGTTQEITVEGGIANVADAVLLDHNLTNSYLWAHVQSDGGVEVGRILSARGLRNDGKSGLLPQREYVAVLVPAFNEAGLDMWTVNGNDVQTNFGKKGFLPAFQCWQFMTAEAGDFETLAAALHLPPAGDVGKAKLLYRRDIVADGLPINEELEIRGAITSLQKEPDQQESIRAVRADLNLLNDPLKNTIGLPQYGRPWLSSPNDVLAGWPKDINEDARFRGIAGLGSWMAIKAQEDLVDAAVKQAGALREAGQRIGNLAFGLLASASLWNNRMPTDKNERLRLLGPLMGRMLATDGGLVLDRVTTGTSPLSPALFSSAAQRVLRDRSAQTRHITGANGGLSRSDALNEANQPSPLPERTPDGLPHVDTIAREMGLKTPDELLGIDNNLLSEISGQVIEFIQRFCDDYKTSRDRLSRDGQAEEIPTLRNEMAEALLNNTAELLQILLSQNHLPCEGQQIIITIGQTQPDGLTAYFSRVLEDSLAQRRLADSLWRALVNCMGIRTCRQQIANAEVPHRETFCEDLLSGLSPPPVSHKKPVNLDLLSDLIVGHLDPRQANPPAKVRLFSRLTGVDFTRLVRPEFKVGLDFPTWDLLKRYDKEWLLPGVNGLEKDSILALQTNTSFIDAYMLGINTQFISEMRWRDLAVDRTCTPLRMFWGQVNYATQKRQADIEPLAEWAKAPADPVGALSHQTLQPDDNDNQTGNRLVIVFRSDLFRRYPSTLVYLVKPGAEDNTEAKIDALLQQPPSFEHGEGGNERAKRKFFGPLFVGNITPEITFFSFDVTPDELEKYWLVLDEPPAELRFRNDKLVDIRSSAVFAISELDKPTRVAISGDELKKEALINVVNP